MARIQVVIDEVEREAFRAQAQRAGLSLSEWMRRAARVYLRESKPAGLTSAEALLDFFHALDAQQAQEGEEDSWEAHKARIAASKTPPRTR